MRPILFLPVILAAFCGGTLAAAGSTNVAAANRVLMIESSSMPVAGGRATLTIGPLDRAAGVYTGDYQIKVSPYFYKNEKGRLAIVVSDESLAQVSQGKAAAIVGTATTSGQGGVTRPIDATATPVDINHGTLKLWFMAGDRQMTFEPAYHFAEEGTAVVVAKATDAKPNSNLQIGLAASPRQAPDPDPKHP
ncbi:MAG: hypothetical protein ABSA47_09385 [Verrucomicrobiota bacterium]|jgi:hypothetical protein